MNEANAVMFFLITAATTAAAAIWISPKGAAYVAQVLTARSVALRAAREAYRREYRRVMPVKGEAAQFQPMEAGLPLPESPSSEFAFYGLDNLGAEAGE